MTKISNIAVALVVGFVAFVALGVEAHAGIIVTVGKPMPEDVARHVKAGTLAIYPTPGSGSSSNGSEKSQSACYVDKTGQTVCNQKIDPFTGVPVGWHCVPIGNGQLYCEGPGIGVGPEEGGAGRFDPSDDAGLDDDNGLDDTQIEAMGCAAGMGLSGGIMGIVSVVAMLVFLMRARRR